MNYILYDQYKLQIKTIEDGKCIYIVEELLSKGLFKNISK